METKMWEESDPPINLRLLPELLLVLETRKSSRKPSNNKAEFSLILQTPHIFQLLFLCFQAAIIQDFKTLRSELEKEGLFKAKPLFFCLHLGHILLLEALAWIMVSYWGTSWTLTLLCAAMLATSQVIWTLFIENSLTAIIDELRKEEMTLKHFLRRRLGGCSMTLGTFPSSRSPNGITWSISLSLDIWR